MYTESKQTAQRTNTWRKAARWLDAQSSQYSVRSRATNWWALGSTLWSIVSSLSSLTFISMTTSRTCDSSLSNSSSASCSHSLQPQTPASSSSLLLTGSSDTVCDTCGCHMTIVWRHLVNNSELEISTVLVLESWSWTSQYWCWFWSFGYKSNVSKALLIVESLNGWPVISRSVDHHFHGCTSLYYASIDFSTNQLWSCAFGFGLMSLGLLVVNKTSVEIIHTWGCLPGKAFFNSFSPPSEWSALAQEKPKSISMHIWF